MTRIFLPFALSALAAPALAHQGAHLHPHGAGDWLILALALALVGAVGFILARRR